MINIIKQELKINATINPNKIDNSYIIRSSSDNLFASVDNNGFVKTYKLVFAKINFNNNKLLQINRWFYFFYSNLFNDLLYIIYLIE